MTDCHSAWELEARAASDWTLLVSMRRTASRLISALLVAGTTIAVSPVAAGADDVIGLRVTGRAMYEDADGNMQPVRDAEVEACDRDGPWPLDCDAGTHPDDARGRTGSDGRFDLVFSGGDLLPGDRPDVYVRVTASSPAGNVTLETGIAVFEYCMATAPYENYDAIETGFDFNVGTISPDNTVPCNFLSPTFADVDQEHAAWQQLQFLNEVHAVAEDSVGDISPVSILWPSSLNGVPFYLPGGSIRMVPRFDEDGEVMVPGFEDDRMVLYHEYGHHILYSYAESPIPDYDNDVCDETNPLRDLPLFGGHCFWDEEKGSIHWTEGFPNFWAEFVRETTFPGAGPQLFGVDTDDDGKSDVDVSSENPYLADGTSPTPEGDRNQFVEAWTHVILRDLWDNEGDNHDADEDATGTRENDSADRVSFVFDDLWDVIQTDPDAADIFHNYPTTILEFHDLLVAAHPERENRINAVFTENGIFQFGADLGARNVTASETALARGELLTVGDETFNAAASVGTGEKSRTTYHLEPEYEWMGEVDLGFRLVLELEPGGSSAGGRNALVPSSAIPGTYTLVACADGNHKIYESRPVIDNTMIANCSDGPQVTIVNRAPVADAGGPYAFAEGSGGTLDGAGSYDPDGDALEYAWSNSSGILAGPLNGDTVGVATNADDGAYTVTLEVTDPYGESDTDTAEVVVTNVAPLVDAGDDVAVDEGTEVSRTITVIDPVDTAFDATVDWGDGSVSLGTVSSSFVVSHTFDDDAVVTAEVCVDDGDDTACDSFEVGVSNVAPALDDDPIVVSATEGTPVGGSAAFTDPGADTWSVGVTWGDLSYDDLALLAARSVPLDHTYVQDGSYLGAVCVTDDDLGGDCSVLQATVANAPPVLGSVAVGEPAMALVEVPLSVEFSDLGVLDVHSATIDWADGAGPQPATVTEPAGDDAGAVTGSRTYSTEGDRTVVVCVSDDDDTTCVSRVLDVMSVADAADYTVDELMSRGSSDPAILAAIGALDGTVAHASSGALDKILVSDWVAAIGKLREAVVALDGATTDESAAQGVLTVIAEAIARRRLAAVEARGFTARGTVKQVRAIRADVVEGRVLYLAGSFVAAIDEYKSATRAAVDLLRKA